MDLSWHPLFFWLVVCGSGARAFFWHGGTICCRHRWTSTLRGATTTTTVKRRPSIQNVTQPRPARRMNHAFKYLYRNDNVSTTDPMEYLINEGGWTRQQVVQMNESFPELLHLSVKGQLHPKMQFLKRTLGVQEPHTLGDLPPQYFGARLERILAPRHAFLVWMGLPSGRKLFERDPFFPAQTRFATFLKLGRQSKAFAALCQSWRSETNDSNNNVIQGRITAKHVHAFDALFARGLLAAARNDLTPHDNTLAQFHLTPAQLTRLLIQHGANPMERDHRGATLVHWACGTGHWEVVEELAPFVSVLDRGTREESTPLHWGAAGTTAREFGVGGHFFICENLIWHMKSVHNESIVRKYVNSVTRDGNSALMWAAWSGSLDTVKLLVRHRADTSNSNENGCTVAHWASSGGNLQVCQYLAETIGVDFSVANYGGNTPLTHAVAFGRSDVVEWLLKHLPDDKRKEDTLLALSLAEDFVQWTGEGDERRNNVLRAFDKDYIL